MVCGTEPRVPLGASAPAAVLGVVARVRPEDPMHRTRTRLFALLLGVAPALGVMSAPVASAPVASAAPAGAQADPAPTPAEAAGRWLAEEHRWHTDAVAVPPTTATDALLAWAATGTEHTAAQSVRAAVASRTTSTLTLDVTARVLLALAVYGEDPADVGGVDLDASLRAFVTEAGRFTTARGGSTPATGVGLHARGVLALAMTSGGVPAATATALAGTQCGDGSFPAVWAGSTCGDVEATALAAQALRAAGSTADATEAETWLLGRQGPDGGFGSAGSDLVGLAAQTLRAAGHATAADAAAGYVTGLQLGTDAGVWDHDEGAIAQDPGARADAVVAGEIPLGVRLTAFRAPTMRAVLALGAPAYVAMTPPPVSEAPPEPVRWRAGACAPDEGVNVVVDLRVVTDRLDVRCALGDQISGWAALANAGYPVGSVPGYPGAALCQLDGLPAAGYPSCWYEGYWSYYHAPSSAPGATWEYSSWGYNNRKPALNSVEGSRYVLLSSENAPPAVGPSFPTPEVAIDAGPEATTTSADAAFTFTSSEVESDTACSLDGAEPVPCASPYQLTGVAPGDHTLEVTATTPARRTGSDTWAWTVLGAPECAAVPQAPTFDIVDSEEDLAFTLADGYPVEHAVLTDLQADPAQATFTAGAVVDLAPYEGQTIRVVARRAGAGCAEAGLFSSVYDVRAAYAPRWNAPSGTPGSPSPAVAASDPAIVGWATGHSEYTPGPNVSPSFQVPANAYGPVDSSLVVLGDHGTITLTFATPIADGEGYDLAVFENGFASGANDFLELGYVEVSSDGTDFVRFDSASRRTATVGGFGTQSPGELGGLAGKDLSGRGTPFDLSLLANRPEVRDGTVDLDRITHVRIRDVHGAGDDPSVDSFGRTIHDPTPTTGSGGFDLTGVGVLHPADVTAPVVEITDGPPAVSPQRTATIAYTVDDPTATVEHRVDGGAWLPAPASPIELADLTHGAHTVEVRATDGAGLVGTDSIGWTIDVEPPALLATAGPDGPVGSRTGPFAFEAGSDAVVVECRVTATSDWAPCTSPWTATAPADGPHVTTVRAEDAVGNAAEATWTWTADTVAPVVSITAGPADGTTATTATFAYAIEDPTGVAAVDCRIDGGVWSACPDPIAYAGLAAGPHTFEVRVVDEAGNDGTDAHTWTIRTPRSADEAWLWAAHEDFLDRAPTPAEVVDGLARLGAGTPRSTLARELATSDEWLSVVVTRFYADTLGRSPGARELAYWTGELASGRRTVATVAAGFYGSAEYVTRAGGTADAWIADLYDALLGRPATPDDVAYWTARATAQGRGRVALQLFQSLESRRARVETLYQALLGRPADDAGRDFWAARLTHDGDIALARHLASSSEYATRAHTRFP